MDLGKLKRRVWFRLAMRGSGQNDPFKQLNRLYVIRDPWNIDSPGELRRLTGTNEAVERAFGRVPTLLEVGSGEGVQSLHLRKLCDRLTGIDVIPRAVKRARKRLPDAEFHVGQLQDMPWAKESGKFDVVVAAEVLNYMADPAAFCRMITNLSKKGCLVTYMKMNEPKLGPVVRAIPGVHTETLTFGDHNDKTTHIAWWPKMP